MSNSQLVSVVEQLSSELNTVLKQTLSDPVAVPDEAAWDIIQQLAIQLDGIFAQLEILFAQNPPTDADLQQIAVVQQVHTDNQRMMRTVQHAVSSALTELAALEKFSSYAPVPPGQQPSARMFDGSA